MQLTVKNLQKLNIKQPQLHKQVQEFKLIKKTVKTLKGIFF